MRLLMWVPYCITCNKNLLVEVADKPAIPNGVWVQAIANKHYKDNGANHYVIVGSLVEKVDIKE